MSPRLWWLSPVLLANCTRPPAEAPERPVTAPAPLVVAETEPEPARFAPNAKRVSSLPDEQLQRIYGCWLKAPYPYMFEPSMERGEVLNLQADPPRFMSGIGGIVDYGSLSRCIGEEIGEEKRSYSAVNTIEAFAGMPVHDNPEGQARISMFNPDIVRWGAGALVPAPSLVILDRWTAQQLYNAMFARFFRLMAHSYAVLRQSDNLIRHSHAYFTAIAEGASGLDFLEQRFSGQLGEYGGYWDGTQWTPAMSFGFWLRRNNDGTELALWDALQDFLQLYDPAWLAEMQNKFPQPAGLWAAQVASP